MKFHPLFCGLYSYLMVKIGLNFCTAVKGIMWIVGHIFPVDRGPRQFWIVQRLGRQRAHACDLAW